MTSWQELAAAEPDFAAQVRARFDVRKHATMATLRRDGSPRISGTEIQFAGGQVRLGSMAGAMKALDLRRDPRIALHSPTIDPPEDDPGAWEGEAKLAGRAVEVSTPRGGHEFRIDIEEVVLVRVGVPPDHIVIEAWHPGRGRQRWQRR